tara:strand:+ start:75 stop:1163 length:1089 start_codon:yes stop_codon:yes gene_type:complete
MRNHFLRAAVGGGSEVELYSFSSFTFKTHLTYSTVNTAGDYGLTDGYQGSLLSELQALSSYSSTSWYNDTNLFRMNTRGFQEWKVPSSGNYKIKCMGAGGGYGRNQYANVPPQGYGGKGSYAEGTIALNQGDWLQIIVGHCGKNVSNTQAAGGGGGGSFVLHSTTGSFTTSNIILAGGGGGGGAGRPGPYDDGVDASTTTSGTDSAFPSGTSKTNRSPGTNGYGAGGSVSNGDWGGGDGAGLLSDGNYSEMENGNSSSTGMGRSYSNGFLGGHGEPFAYQYGHNGGFGGGGASSWAPAGGGGYSGGSGDYSDGSGSSNSNSPDGGPQGGGGGGLYYSNLLSSVTTGNASNPDHGYVEVTKVS